MSKKNWLRILMVFVCLMLVCTCVPAEDCAHPEGRQQVMYSDWESATFMNNDDGRTHTATYVNPFEMIKCMDCGLEYRVDLTMDPVVERMALRAVCVIAARWRKTPAASMLTARTITKVLCTARSMFVWMKISIG